MPANHQGRSRAFSDPKVLSVASLTMVARAQANSSHCRIALAQPQRAGARQSRCGRQSCNSSRPARSRAARVALNSAASPKTALPTINRGTLMLRRGEGVAAHRLVRLAQDDREIAGEAESKRHPDRRQRQARGNGGRSNGGQPAWPAGLDIADPAISTIAPIAHQIVNKFCAMLLATVRSAAAVIRRSRIHPWLTSAD